MDQWMLIQDPQFVPKYFIVAEFYGEDSYFCWNADKLMIFPYKNDNNVQTRVLNTPAPIKNIQCFCGRIFVICIPSGIYKISRNLEFALLSKNAIGIGSVFYEVLTPKDDCLYLDNKQNKSSKPLFQLSSSSKLSELRMLPLNSEITNINLKKALTDHEYDQDMCAIANGRKLFILKNGSIRLIYYSESVIVSVLPIHNNMEIIGLILLVTNDVGIMLYPKNNKLSFDKIYFGTKVHTLCAGVCQQVANVIWILHSDQFKLYYTKKNIVSGTTQQVKIEEKSLVCLQFYKGTVILGLSRQKDVLKLPVDIVENIMISSNNDFISLKANMLKDSDLIVSQICDKVKELEILNQTLLAEQDKLRRINLFAYKKRMRLHPKMIVQRISDQTFLTVDFQDALPENTQVIVALETDCQRIFCMKKVSKMETRIEMRIPMDKISSSTSVTLDLVTLRNKGMAWCLIKDFVEDPVLEKHKKTRSKKNQSNFLKTKLTTLQNLKAEGTLDMKRLSEIRNSVRKEMCDI